MIVICLSGGLGNQLFQYAFGRVLSLKNKNELYFYDGLLNKKKSFLTYREYKLHHFRINIKLANKKDLEIFEKKSILSIIKNIAGKSDYKIYQDFKIGFKKELLKITEDIFLEGYFQSPKYFDSIRNLLLSEIQIKEKEMLNKKENEFINMINNSVSVSIHIRRGDYFNNKATNKMHGVCTIDYYNNAINYIQNLFNKNCTLYIFSDDVNWVKQNFKIEIEHFYASDYILNKDYLELLCISYCQHQIISNSSFSWWGAWLNKNPNKIVICPEFWYRDYPTKSIDLIPKNWLIFK